MILDVEESRLIKYLLDELQDRYDKKIEEIINNASHSNNEGATSFTAGQADTIEGIRNLILEKIEDMKTETEAEWK